MLQFDGGNFPAYLGKGYGELQIIKYAVEHSELLEKCDFIVKITGRYLVENIDTFLKELQTEDRTLVVADYDKQGHYTYGGLFIARPVFFISIFSLYKNLLMIQKKVL